MKLLVVVVVGRVQLSLSHLERSEINFRRVADPVPFFSITW